MVKRKKPEERKESKSVDAMPQLLSRDPSKAATVFSDMDGLSTGLGSPTPDLMRSPGHAISVSVSLT